MREFNVLIASAGRRVALLRIFRQALRDLELAGRVAAIDASRASAAFHDADAAWVVPKCLSPDHVACVLDLCRKERIRLIVPTIDTELPVYAAHRHEFEAADTIVAVSSPEVVAIGGDKVLTHEWLVAHGFPTVRQASVEELLDSADRSWEFPLILKPRFGSASLGVCRIRDAAQLRALATPGKDIVQALAPGDEYTIDVLIDRRGRCRCAVPRKRLETRGGEVSKGMTERRADLIQLATRLAETLPGAYGALNIQVFHDAATNATNVIEVNPRFGGGFPLTWQAGGLYPRWMIQELLGLPCDACDSRWEDRLVMLRYDDAVFVRAAAAGQQP